MTQEPPPTQVEDIVVRGQRKWPGGTFPPPSRGGDVGGGPDVPTPETVDPDGPPVDDHAHPCDDPETAREWNADAAAAEALRRMIAYAAARNDATHNLYNREYGAMICESPSGDLFISDIVHGDPIFDAGGTLVGVLPQDLAVDLRLEHCGHGNRPVAMIHSHPMTGPGGGLPSASDAVWVAAINGARGDSQGRIYVVSISGSSSPFRISVYDASNIASAGEGATGPEVNPEGRPCFGVEIL